MTTKDSGQGAGAYPTVYRHLLVAGLLGTLYGAREDAAIVTAAVENTLADAREFQLCRALAQSLHGQSDEARETLEAHLNQHPDDAQAQVVLAAVLMRLRNPLWRPMLDNVLATTLDQPARQAARDLLEAAQAMQS